MVIMMYGIYKYQQTGFLYPDSVALCLEYFCLFTFSISISWSVQGVYVHVIGISIGYTLAQSNVEI